MKPGMIVFFKEGKVSSHPKAHKFSFKGHGIALLLGHVHNFQKDPDLNIIKILLGRLGYLSFDDVKDFLGKEKQKICVDLFEQKYTPPQPLIETPDTPPISE